MIVMRYYFARIVLVFLSVLLSVGLIEFGLWLFPSLIQNNFRTLAWNHWTYPYEHDINKESLDYYTSKYVFDSSVGYINKVIIDRIEAKNSCTAKKKYSILVLGDSVSESGKYVGYLEDQLQQTYGAENIEVLNAGVSGYDTKLEEAFLKKFGINYEPDLVLLQFNINDFTGTPVIVKNGENSWLAFNTNTSLNSINKKLFQYSRIYQYYVTWALKNTQTESDPIQVVKPPMAGIAQFLKEHQKDLAIIYFPKFEDSADTVEKRELFTQIISELQLSKQTLDLTPAYQDMELTEISLDTTHPNEKGDRIAEQKIFEFLKPLLDKKLTSVR